jgi:hypothetical protein
MFAEFRSQYPKGSIKTEMLPKVDGMHTFRAEISSEGIILATAMGCDPDLETAEDRAVKRALAIAGISDNYRLNYHSSYAQIEAALPSELPRLQQSYQTSNSSLELPQAVNPLKPEKTTAKPADKPAENKSVGKILEKRRPVEPDLEDTEPPEPPMDLSDLISQTDVQMQRVGWNQDKGKEYLMKNFRKTSRQQLTAKELHQFLSHLKSLPPYLETYPSDQEF